MGSKSREQHLVAKCKQDRCKSDKDGSSFQVPDRISGGMQYESKFYIIVAGVWIIGTKKPNCLCVEAFQRVGSFPMPAPGYYSF